MSSIGGGNLGAVGLATVLAGGQRSDSPSAKADAARIGADFAQRASTLGATSDIAQSHNAEDRDADGRLPWTREEAPAEASSGPSDGASGGGQHRGPIDPTGRTGARLDLSV